MCYFSIWIKAIVRAVTWFSWSKFRRFTNSSEPENIGVCLTTIKKSLELSGFPRLHVVNINPTSWLSTQAVDLQRRSCKFLRIHYEEQSKSVLSSQILKDALSTDKCCGWVIILLIRSIFFYIFVIHFVVRVWECKQKQSITSFDRFFGHIAWGKTWLETRKWNNLKGVILDDTAVYC